MASTDTKAFSPFNKDLPDARYVPTTDKKGAFVRGESKHRKQIGTSEFPVERDRYLVYIALACPWASRVTAYIDLMGLQDVIEVVSVQAEMERTKPETENDKHIGWVFAKEKGGRYIRPDPIFTARTLREIYEKCGDYEGKFTTPLLFDKKQKTIVNNESSEIIRMLNKHFAPQSKNPVDYYPKDLQTKIDETNEWVYHHINNGVYRAGFATTQEAYEEACKGLFEHLEKAEQILSNSRYLCSETQMTEADIRLFETLVRFDHVYHTHFKCNIKRIRDYPNLFNFTKEIYQCVPETVDIEEIKNHYYKSHAFNNPSKIVPIGPKFDYGESHDRDKKVTA